MPIPSQPANLIPRPFASQGTVQIIPDTPTTSGRASFQQGFPTETQLPLREGGVAPNRMDFQGLFNLLTAFGFWQQSGGLWNFTTALNYQPPCFVMHINKLWWCNKENGPESGNGIVEPGSSTEYWIDFLSALANMSGSSGLGTPIGGIILYPTTTPPKDFLACNGDPFDPEEYPALFELLGIAQVPDMRGLVPRGYDPTGYRDPDGATRTVLSVQDFAMEKITGRFSLAGHGGVNGGDYGGTYPQPDGLFSPTGYNGSLTPPSARNMNRLNASGYTIDTSKVAKTSVETRGANISVLYIIRAA
jgi:hypothetical protein